MRAASGLLVAVLLTTCVISGTFAKYTTSAEGTDSARVAKWGFQDTSSITLNGLFNNVYDETVKSNTDVIAPGTKGEAKFKFNYTDTTTKPEVDYKFTVSTEGSDCAKDIQDNDNIQWKLDTGKWGTWTELKKSIEDLAGTTSKTTTYKAGNLPEQFNGTTEHTVAWQWVFDKDAVDTKGDKDTDDTKLGNKEALDNVTLKISITAEQVD